ncbi:MAG TPA: cytochrome C554 [Deltaproteobacteria bacterium]|nr:MAG: hypothetical protein A2Z79_12510 [Deltaproteobacteria bacterium GWA2_55_82]OGQ63991.1 MAG: hypothetical protein A3I81_08040 [Deltaproteobacteria bacterium RIFCSPLOWO2_02_FULL_55_12]OIJ73424.1 MAG: hypothetical protein A2V21_303580 [Deltaproteobacteria bacterium GWC2_55_46]HBG47287.1 cytochrome C554 [Deltaproteobacteria bacterium]HCY10053.1 cytochrome C554 [Deltaproteobacteria bacterium]
MSFMKLFISAAFVTVLAGSAWAAPKYVGVDGCKCHKSEISDWERSSHAKAFDLLSPGKKDAKKKKAGLDPDKDYSSDPKCVKCHTTGYKDDGGFTDLSSTAKLAGVGCEMCHGPGSDYRQIHKEKTTKFTRAEVKAAGQLFGSVDPQVCYSCHKNKDNPFRDEGFDVKEAIDNSRAFHKLYPLEGNH